MLVEMEELAETWQARSKERQLSRQREPGRINQIALETKRAWPSFDGVAQRAEDGTQNMGCNQSCAGRLGERREVGVTGEPAQPRGEAWEFVC